MFKLTLTVRCRSISDVYIFSTEAVHHPKPPETKIENIIFNDGMRLINSKDNVNEQDAEFY